MEGPATLSMHWSRHSLLERHKESHAKKRNVQQFPNNLTTMRPSFTQQKCAQGICGLSIAVVHIPNIEVGRAMLFVRVVKQCSLETVPWPPC